MKTQADVADSLFLARLSDELRGLIERQRTAAAQMEWERWKRVVGTLGLGFRTSIEEMRKVISRLDIEARDERDLLRYLELIAAGTAEMDSENWLKSPMAMAELRGRE